MGLPSAQQKVHVVEAGVDPAEEIYEFLVDQTAGSTNEAVGDYSVTPERFIYDPGDRRVHIYRMIVLIEDTGSFDSGRYGNNIVLTNGIHVNVRDGSDNIVQDLDGGVPVITNSHWAGLCHDLTLFSFGAGNNVATVRWTFSRGGVPLFLDGTKGHYLSVELNDNFSGLEAHRFMAQGVKR